MVAHPPIAAPRRTRFVACALGLLLLAAADARAAKSPGPSYLTPQARAAAVGGTASAVDVAYLQGRKPAVPDAITALGPDAFGDRVNLYNGSFSFEHTDISLPGNSELPVALVRTHSPGRSWQVRGVLADWDLNTPRIEGSFALPEGWVGASGSAQTRCSAFAAPPTVYRPHRGEDGQLFNTEFLPHEYWQGTQLVVPGQGGQEILANSRLPTEGGRWPMTTRQQWQIGCLPTVLNAPGEGFIARSPAGVTYHFNWMASRQQRMLLKVNGLLRADMYLMATLVTDRFGNWVRYHYDPARPMNLLRIEANDGRVITLRYSGDRLVSASDGDAGAAAPPPPSPVPPPPGCPNCDHQRASASLSTPALRTWSYAYNANGDLASVTQPDGHAWRFELRGLVTESEPVNEGTRDCDGHPTPMGYAGAGTVTHPSGAVARFEADQVYQPLSNVPRVCTYFTGELGNWTNGSVYPRETIGFALRRKTITAPGAEPMVWRYDGPNLMLGSWAPCTTCPDRKVVQVTEPDGKWTRHEFGIRWRENEGQLLKTEEGEAGSSTPLRTTWHGYREPGTEFPNSFGDSPNLLYDWGGVVNRPNSLRRIRQQDVDFEWAGHRFDGRARVVLSRASSGGRGRDERITYDDLGFAAWGVVGLVSRREVKDLAQDETGWLTAEHNVYHPAPQTALLHRRIEFGQERARFEYATDGTLRHLFDGRGNRTEFSHYHRGRPQRVVFADGHVAMQTIHNAGWVLQHTNEAGSTHQLSYDPMGRLTRVRYPTGDPVVYCDTVLSFTRSAVADRGLPAGHWRQRIETCGDVTERWFDGLWRTRLERRYDGAAPAATASTIETAYDVMGRPAFKSRAQRDINPLGQHGAGTKWTHDGLGRVTKQIEVGSNGHQHITETRYLTGFKREVRNPRGAVTTTSFQAFDEPVESLITFIELPELAKVDIRRDFLGKALSITRSGPGPQGTVSATRTYVYDGHQQLCKTIEPEAGATLRQFDAAGNLAWVAPGSALTSAVCDREAVPAHRRITHGYDARNRLRWTVHGDGSGRIDRNYEPDGLLASITSSRPGRHTLTWTYSHNRARVLTGEHHSWGDPTNSWPFTYGIDNRRQRASYADRWGTVALDPDALGRPRQVGIFAHSVRYHPDGSVASYVLGNGIAFRNELGPFGRPQHWQHVGRMHLTYSYDAVGNVTAIDDALDPARSVSLPHYDLLDRLRQANGPWTRGTRQPASYEYDGLDNLVSSTVGSRTLVHEMDRSRNRLSGLRGSQNVDMAYDNAGNIIRRGDTHFTFDIANRLLSSTAHLALDYDGHGRRTLTWWVGGSYRHTGYTQDGLLRMDWRSHQGNRRYIYLAGKLIAEQRDGSFGGDITYAHADILGSPVLRTNAAGVVVQNTVHEPYGATAAGWDVPQRVGYTGHVNDPETGLVYMQQRYYDPIAGRFLSVDPVTTDAKTGQHFNRYVYAENNPYALVDPDGRAPVCSTDSNGCKHVGTPQTTGTPGHETASAKMGAQASQQGAAEVHYNRSLAAATGNPAAGQQRPDVTVIWKDRKVSTVEVVSNSQSVASQAAKGQVMQSQLGAIGRAGAANTVTVNQAMSGTAVRGVGAVGVLGAVVRAAEIGKIEQQEGGRVPMGTALQYMGGYISREQVIDAARGGMN